MTPSYVTFIGSVILFRIITLNLFFVAFSWLIRFYRKFYTMRERILHAIVNVQVPIYKTLMPKNKKWKYTKAQLLQFPEATLGKDVGVFLETNNFDFIPFLETHDVYHVLFGYKTTISDESRLYFFLLGTGKYSLEVLGTVAVSLILLPELIFDFEKHYERGKNCVRIRKRRFQNELYTPTEKIRKQIFSV